MTTLVTIDNVSSASASAVSVSDLATTAASPSVPLFRIVAKLREPP